MSGHPWERDLETGRADVAAGRISELEPFLKGLAAKPVLLVEQTAAKASPGE